MTPKRLEIWWVELDPTVGTETRKTRPVVVLSNDIINTNGPRVAIAPLMKGHKPFHYVVNVSPTDTNHLDQDRRIDLTQLRFVDKARLRGRQGTLSEQDDLLHRDLQSALNVVFALRK
jgi:mRNA interferase MazF